MFIISWLNFSLRNLLFKIPFGLSNIGICKGWPPNYLTLSCKKNIILNILVSVNGVLMAERQWLFKFLWLVLRLHKCIHIISPYLENFNFHTFNFVFRNFDCRFDDLKKNRHNPTKLYFLRSQCSSWLLPPPPSHILHYLFKNDIQS